MEHGVNCETWQIAYVAYLLWVAGLSMFYLIATTHGQIRLLKRIGQNWLGVLICVWLVSAFVISGFAWPLLIIGPLLIVKMGAPVGTGAIAAAYMIFSFWLCGRMLISRWPSVFSK